jgi:hypothetical protein
VNDDELGRALGTALAAPEVLPAADAGARLRARAHRERTERWMAGGVAVLVLAILAAAGVVRIAAVGPAPTAAAGPSTLRMLHTSLDVWLGPKAAKIPWPPCGAQGYCPPLPILTMDQVAGLRTTATGQVVVRLMPDRARMFELYTRPVQWSDLQIRVGARSLPATYSDGILRATAPTAAQAEELVAALGLYQPVGRTGPGRLDKPLQVYAADSICRGTNAGPEGLWRQVGQCLAASMAVSIDDANVEVHGPDGHGSGWSVTIDAAGPARERLARWSAANLGQQVVYGIPDPAYPSGGYVENEATITVVRGEMTSIRIPVLNEAAAQALVSRLRP